MRFSNELITYYSRLEALPSNCEYMIRILVQ